MTCCNTSRIVCATVLAFLDNMAIMSVYNSSWGKSSHGLWHTTLASKLWKWDFHNAPSKNQSKRNRLCEIRGALHLGARNLILLKLQIQGQIYRTIYFCFGRSRHFLTKTVSFEPQILKHTFKNCTKLYQNISMLFKINNFSRAPSTMHRPHAQG